MVFLQKSTFTKLSSTTPEESAQCEKCIYVGSFNSAETLILCEVYLFQKMAVLQKFTSPRNTEFSSTTSEEIAQRKIRGMVMRSYFHQHQRK